MKKWLTLNKEANWVLKILYFLMTVLEITVHKKKHWLTTFNYACYFLVPCYMYVIETTFLENNVKMGDICSILQMNEHDWVQNVY